uniref:Uncharacterized protein n=1 Tax=Rhizophora mucronata TaxID=61149 RepID=A0A2P2MQC0_RHIMU
MYICTNFDHWGRINQTYVGATIWHAGLPYQKTLTKKILVNKMFKVVLIMGVKCKID